MVTVSVEQFTDPFSPWCWAAQPALRRLRYEFDDVEWTPRMTLLVPPPGEADERSDDGSDDDAMRRTRWAATAATSEMPVADGLWAEALPSSSLSCAAVALVRETEPGLAMAVLRRLRVAALAGGHALDEPDAVAAVAAEVNGVDRGALSAGLEDGRAADALADDLERAVAVAGELEACEVRGDLQLLPAAERLRSLDSVAAPTPDGSNQGAGEEDEEDEPQLLGPPALRIERESVVVADPRVSYSRLASAFGRAVPQTGIDIDDKYATSRMAMHVPREVAESLSSEDFGATVRPYLERFGRAYLPEVVAGTGVSRNTCRAALDSLVERGQAERVGPAEWRIVDGAGGRGGDA